MKKLIIICLIVFSCSTDSTDSNNDNNNQEATHLIVGEWKSFRSVTICDDNEERIENDEIFCEGDSRLIFFENGTLYGNSYDSPDGINCNLFSESYGTWEIINDELKITDGGYTSTIEYWEVDLLSFKWGRDEFYVTHQTECTLNGEVTGYITLTYEEYHRVN